MMTTAQLIAAPVLRVYDNSGNLAVSGSVYTYIGGTSTPVQTFTDSTAATPNTNPIILNSRGECSIWVLPTQSYKLVAYDANNNLLWTKDNIQEVDSQPVTVSSIASLRLVSKTQYSEALVNGYYANGDGGGGTYYYDSSDTSSADNGGTIIVASDGARWKLVNVGIISVRQFGAKGDGVTDDTTAINAAITYVDSLGGGKVFFPPGTYATPTGITIGNGTNTSVSTIHNKITLYGSGYGSGSGIINQEINGASRILYTGASNSTANCLAIAGPMYGVCVEDLTLDCNALAAHGLNQIHLTQGTFRRVSVRNPTAVGYQLTTRSGNPSGCAFGNADNRYYDCYSFIDNAGLASNDIVGISLTSGVSTSTSLVGQPDSARNVFIGGTFFYGTTSNSYGVYLSGADNNTLIETEFAAYGGSTSGKDIWFQQWPGSGNFPLENHIQNPGMNVGVGGNGGVGSGWGNTIFPMTTADGATFPPAVTGLSGGNHLGQSFVAGVQAYRGRQVLQASSTTPQSTSSITYSAVTGYSISITTRANSYLVIDFNGSATKATAGSGYFELGVNAINYGETQCFVGATGFYAAVACKKLVAVGAGTQVVTLQFASSDGNAVTLNNGTLTVQELY